VLHPAPLLLRLVWGVIPCSSDGGGGEPIRDALGVFLEARFYFLKLKNNFVISAKLDARSLTVSLSSSLLCFFHLLPDHPDEKSTEERAAES